MIRPLLLLLSTIATAALASPPVVLRFENPGSVEGYEWVEAEVAFQPLRCGDRTLIELAVVPGSWRRSERYVIDGVARPVPPLPAFVSRPVSVRGVLTLKGERVATVALDDVPTRPLGSCATAGATVASSRTGALDGLELTLERGGAWFDAALSRSLKDRMVPPTAGAALAILEAPPDDEPPSPPRQPSTSPSVAPRPAAPVSGSRPFTPPPLVAAPDQPEASSSGFASFSEEAISYALVTDFRTGAHGVSYLHRGGRIVYGIFGLQFQQTPAFNVSFAGSGQFPDHYANLRGTLYLGQAGLGFDLPLFPRLLNVGVDLCFIGGVRLNHFESTTIEGSSLSGQLGFSGGPFVSWRPFGGMFGVGVGLKLLVLAPPLNEYPWGAVAGVSGTSNANAVNLQLSIELSWRRFVGASGKLE